MKHNFILAAAIMFSVNVLAAKTNDSISTPERVMTLAEQREDSIARSHYIIDIDGGVRKASVEYADSMRQLINAFYYDQFRHFQDPAAPYFLFMSKDSQLAMGIGGCVRMRGWYDWGGAIPVNGFAPYLIPMQSDPTKMRRFGTTPSGTTLFFRVIGRNKTFGNYQLYIEANFNGWQGRGIELKKAYAEVRNFTIGYAASTFSDPSALPPTVDAQGPTNKISPTSVLVRWMRPLRNNRWSIALSAETPATQIASDSMVKKCDDWLPDFAAFVQYQWSRSQHVRLAAILRTLSYRDLAVGRNHTRAGWGVMLSSVTSPHPKVTLYANASTGQGYESLGGDLQIGNYDLVPDPNNPSAMYAPWGLGWNVGVQYNFTPMIFCSANYSQTRYMPRHPAAPWEYKCGQVITVNAFWNLTARIMVGAELDLGERRNMDGTHRWARRIGAVAQFAF